MVGYRSQQQLTEIDRPGARRLTGDRTGKEAMDIAPTQKRTMFTIDTREGSAEVVIMGRPTRKRAVTMLNIPISEALRARLQEQIIGSVAMGSSALLEWALEELERQRVSIQAQANQ